MTKLKAVSLGCVIGMMLGVMRICSAADETIAEANATLERIETRQTRPVSVSKQVMKDIEELEETEMIKWAPYKNIALADEYQIYLEALCADMEINFFLVVALYESESGPNFDQWIGDSGNSIGIAQINKCWWGPMEEDYGLDVTEPLDNMEAGLIILKDLMTKYPDDVALVIQCYKCGEYRGKELYEKGFVLDAVETVVNRALEMEEEAER